MTNATRNLPWFPAKLISCGVVTLLSLAAVWGYYGEAQKEQWREVANYVDTRAKPEDLILFHAGYSQRPFNYYSRRSDLSKKSFPAGIMKSEGKAMEDLSSLVNGRDRVWLVVSHSHDHKGLGVKALGKVCRLIIQQDFKGIKIYLFRNTGGRRSQPASPRAPASEDEPDMEASDL